MNLKILKLNRFLPFKMMHKFEIIERRDMLKLSLLSIPVGIFSAYGAIGLRYILAIAKNVFFYHRLSLKDVNIIGNHLGTWVILTPAIGGLLVALVINLFAKEAKGHGVPEVIEAVLFKEGNIKPKVGLVKAIASGICIGSGGSAGREGPLIQIGATMGSTLGRIFKFKPYMKRILVGCGAAAALAAAFNTPIGGALFVFETFLFEFKTRSFVPLIISTVSATFISRFYFGNYPAFPIPEYTFKHPVEFGFYLLLGLIAGILSVFFINFFYWIGDLFKKLKISDYIKPAIGGLIVGAIGYFYPQVLGNGYDIVEKALVGKLFFGLMAILVFLKIFALSITLGSGGSGGTLAPTLYIGSMLGGSFGYIIHSIFPDFTASPGAYALVGMAAMLSGVNRATLTAIVILFEMTLNYQIILPLMFACVIADGVSWFLSPDTIDTKEFSKKGLHLRVDMEVLPFDFKIVRDVMTKEENVIKVYSNETVGEIWKKFSKNRHHAFPILNRKGHLIGIVTIDEARELMEQGKATYQIKDVMPSKLIVTYPNESLIRVLNKMLLHNVDQLPVVDRKNHRKLVGLLTRSDILRVLKEIE